MEKLTNFELEQIDNQLINDGTDVQVRKLVNEVKAYRNLMKNYGIPNLEYLEQRIKCSDKYGELEEKIGCSLEVRCQMYIGSIIFDLDRNKYSITNMIDKYFYATKKPYNGNMILFYYKDHKKTWWLKKDKSE